MAPQADRDFLDDDGVLRVTVQSRALSAIGLLCVRSDSLETGGVLIGRYANGNAVAVVEEVTPPPRDSLQSGATFVRGIRGLRARLQAAWKAGSYYLGEWHYHPVPTPRPSHVDTKTLERIALNDEMHCTNPVLLIAGRGLALYVATHRAGRLRSTEGEG